MKKSAPPVRAEPEIFILLDEAYRNRGYGTQCDAEENGDPLFRFTTKKRKITDEA